MKKSKFLLTLVASMMFGWTSAQTTYICNEGGINTVSAQDVGEMVFSNLGANVAIGNKVYETSKIDSITLHLPDMKYVGGDISMLTKYEEKNAIYKDISGNVITPLTFFKEQGMNAMRVRLFVDPSKASSSDQAEGAVQDLDYVIALGKRIKEAGYLLMLDFHYSDTWTDPGQHATPSAWSSMTIEQLEQQIHDYTADCLEKMKTAGVTPDFIQPGNEITYGMLWPSGKVYASSTPDWTNFTAYLSNAIKACREECPDSKIVLQTEMSSTYAVNTFYQAMKDRQIDYDIIGLSYYPAYHGNLAKLNTELTTLENAYPSKKLMIVETGYSSQWAINGTTFDYTDTYPYTETGQANFTNDLITMLLQHKNVNGLFWWWPEANEYNASTSVTSAWWNASLFNNKTGYALKALYQLKNFK